MKREFTIAGIMIGAFLALGPLWGLIGTFVGMQRAFDTLDGPGLADPGALSSSIHVVLRSQGVGLIACPIGIALCIFSIIKLQAIRRQPPPLPPPAQGTPDLKA